MAMDISSTAALRDMLYDLNFEQPEGAKVYYEQRYFYIRQNEGCSLYAYDDANGKSLSGSKLIGNATIGIGFNMCTKNAGKEWKQAFGSMVTFEGAKSGRIRIDDAQVRKLFEVSTNIRETELIKIYGESWWKLKLNERLAIEDAYYNSPSLVNSSSRFFRNIQAYATTGIIRYLELAIVEIKERSNPSRDKGIQKRRDSEATLLKPKKPLLATQLKDVLPLGFCNRHNGKPALFEEKKPMHFWVGF